jgi:putative transposase
MPPDTRAKLQQFAAIIRGIDARAQQLNFLVGNVVQDIQLDSVRANPDARKSLFELRAGSTKVAEEVKKKIDFYQDVGYFAKRTQEAAQLAYGAVAACILPILYALLGVCASLLRTFADQTRSRTYLSSFANPARLLIAAIGGVVVGLFNNLNIGEPCPRRCPRSELESVSRRRRKIRKSRFTEEQIVAVLKEHQAGLPVAELCRKHGISDATFYTWRSKGGMEVSDAKRLKVLEEENRKLKKLLAESILDVAATRSGLMAQSARRARPKSSWGYGFVSLISNRRSSIARISCSCVFMRTPSGAR